MIAHISIPARNPQQTAQLLATLMDGETFQFPVAPGAYIAVARDGSGLAVEVYPATLAHHPGQGAPDPTVVPAGPQPMPWEDQIYADGEQLRPSAFHFALTTPLAAEQVLQLAQSAGLRTLHCERGGVFGVIEVWLDNTILVEVLTKPEVERYRQFMNPTGCSAMFGPSLRT